MKAFLLSFLILVPSIALAQYTPLVQIPGLSGEGVDPTDTNTYINTIYALSISIAALLAVIKIVIAGVKWMTTDIVTSKGQAKKDIQGALLGLLLILAAVLIINIINPNIADVNIQPANIPNNIYTPPPPTEEELERQAWDECLESEECSSTQCTPDVASGVEEFLFDIPGAGPIIEAADGAGDRVKCQAFCDYYRGSLIDGACVYPNDTEAFLEEMEADAIAATDFCEGAACEVVDCPTIRNPYSDFRCSSWCENRGGRGLDHGIINTYQCVLPLGSTENISCTPKAGPGGFYDCTAAASTCIDKGGLPQERESNTDSQLVCDYE